MSLPAEAEAIASLSKDERAVLMRMALGRLFRMGARASKPGDELTYARLRAVVFTILEVDAAER
jgi:hypothetical protein